MPIVPLLQKEGFDPKAVTLLREAFQYCLPRLELADRNDLITTLVAQEVIRLARTSLSRSKAKIRAPQLVDRLTRKLRHARAHLRRP